MWRTLGKLGLAGAVVAQAGCMSGPLYENPLPLPAAPAGVLENPVYVPLGPPAYPAVFEKVLDVIDDYFEIAYANRYDGRIETHARIAPGIGQPWKPGSPDLYQRTLATFQTIRHRAIALIQVADDGGFFIDVKVFKELEDLPKPSIPRAGVATFQSSPTVERQFEVIDATTFDAGWIPIGRDFKLEQVILSRLAACAGGGSGASSPPPAAPVVPDTGPAPATPPAAVTP
jgi:hypothetical protein